MLYREEFMRRAIACSCENIKLGGGPFGAVIVKDGKIIADSYYYGKVWRVPARLLDKKECYLAVSELRDDFYKEFNI